MQKDTQLEVKPLIRTLQLDCRVDKESRTISFPFSSEEPVERAFGVEVLDHGQDSVRLGRLRNSAPLLFNHNPDDIVGVVEDASVAGGRGVTSVRFSKTERGEEVLGMVQDGILRNVSVGYRIREIKPDRDERGQEIERVMDWEPFEISMVSIPADNTVGVGRSSDYDTPNTVKRQMDANTTVTEQAPSKQPTGPSPEELQRKVDLAVETATRTEMARLEEIEATRLQCQHIEGIDDAAQDFRSNRKSADEFRKWCLEHQRDTKPPVSSPDIGLTDKEVREYSIMKAIRDIAFNGGLQGLELAAHRACEKQYSNQADGFWVPYDVQRVSLAEANELTDAERSFYNGRVRNLGKRDLSAGVDAAGGFTVQTDVLGGSLIELLRNNMVVAGLGVRMMTGLQGDVAIPRQSGPGTAEWLAEGATGTPADQAFQQVPLVPHRLQAATGYTKQFLIQSTIDAEAFVRDDLAAIQALAIDNAVLAGSGAGAIPEGILNATGTGALTFGGAPTWAKVVEFETTLQTANANRGSVAFVTSPAVQGAWKTTVKEATFPQYLLEGDTANGYRFVATTNLGVNQVIFGNWQDVLVASWGGIDIVVNPFSNDLANSIRIVVNTHNDTVLRHPESMVVSSDAGNQ